MAILILGAGGHGKVVADILQVTGRKVLGFVDDDPNLWGGCCLRLPILGAIEQYARFAPGGLILGVGSNQARARIVDRLGKPAARLWCNAIHPTATIASSARLGRGLVIGAQAVVGPDSSIGDHVVINTSSSVDHDCRVGDYAHIGPGVHLAGGVLIGQGALVGIGAATIPLCTIGEWSVVGAGAVVVSDIPAYVTAKGIPAKWNEVAPTHCGA